MKPSLQLRLGHQLTMTPQLQQAIRLLQLSTVELQMEVQQALESNLMLETVEPDTGEELQQEASGNGEQPSAGDTEGDPESDGPQEASQDTIPEELPTDSAWEDVYESGVTSYSAPESRDNWDYFETHVTETESLQDYLLWQLEMAPLTERDKAIGGAIIDSISDDGYLMSGTEDIRQDLGDEIDLDVDEVEAVLHHVQHFDPVGVGARDLKECLAIQLRQFEPDTPWLKEAQQLVNTHLDVLGSRDHNQIMRDMKLSQPELQEVVQLIQSLNPRPGSQVTKTTPQYIIPDVFVSKRNGQWRVDLNPEASPRIRINPEYASMVRRADNSDDNTYLRNHLQEARWFLKSLRSRNETLLKVARCIVKRQSDSLDHGEEAMKPLVLRDVAEIVEMHESTISRVTNQKYMHTPKGIFEFKYFFSSHVGTQGGGECSSTAIRAMIKKLAASENPVKPLSDSKIAALLSEKGIKIARRTIAKYREALSIPPSNERKKLA
ncbi:MAG: RNA polymerase factor sigma-54 [Gammaproteobacteria bacterium]